MRTLRERADGGYARSLEAVRPVGLKTCACIKGPSHMCKANLVTFTSIFLWPPWSFAEPVRFRFEEQLIMDGYGYAFGLAAGDLDRDGDVDLTSGDAIGGCMYWFENDGAGKFQRHFVQAKSGFGRRRHAGDCCGGGTRFQRMSLVEVSWQIGWATVFVRTTTISAFFKKSDDSSTSLRRASP